MTTSSPSDSPIPIRRTIPFRVVLGVMAALVVVAALGVWGLYRLVLGTPTSRMTVAGLEARLRAETPIGCDRGRVLDWLRTDHPRPASARRAIGA